MHYSLSLVSKTIIVYHAPTRVLGNDKGFTDEERRAMLGETAAKLLGIAP